MELISILERNMPHVTSMTASPCITKSPTTTTDPWRTRRPFPAARYGRSARSGTSPRPYLSRTTRSVPDSSWARESSTDFRLSAARENHRRELLFRTCSASRRAGAQSVHYVRRLIARRHSRLHPRRRAPRRLRSFTALSTLALQRPPDHTTFSFGPRLLCRRAGEDGVGRLGPGRQCPATRFPPDTDPGS